MDPLSVLRDFNTSNKLNLVQQTDGNVQFGDRYSFPAATPVYKAAFAQAASAYYSLQDVLFYLKNRNLKPQEYVMAANQSGVANINIVDRKKILDVLDGVTALDPSLVPSSAVAAAVAVAPRETAAGSEPQAKRQRLAERKYRVAVRRGPLHAVMRAPNSFWELVKRECVLCSGSLKRKEHILWPLPLPAFLSFLSPRLLPLLSPTLAWSLMGSFRHCPAHVPNLHPPPADEASAMKGLMEQEKQLRNRNTMLLAPNKDFRRVLEVLLDVKKQVAAMKQEVAAAAAAAAGAGGGGKAASAAPSSATSGRPQVGAGMQRSRGGRGGTLNNGPAGHTFKYADI
ncbi:hypothetical protein Vretifemale_11085 [Volvox reticuliferus]|uniref:Paf1 complex subunit Cdc73 N-terminal domain-containing protein n=1 Tax=Volvox reticuliferus TaxID=1737510 RepID=A0A8J4CJC7_9CHLO|nr:hypothetical protein Vretifemale_11085 [Volvox reticuliferus]